GVRDPSCEKRASGAGATPVPPRASPAAVSSSTGSWPAARAAASRSSPSPMKRPSRSRVRRRPRRRISLSFSLCGLVIVMSVAYLGPRKRKGRPLCGPPGESCCGCRELGGGSLPGELHESANALGVVDGDVGEDLPVHVDLGLLQAIHQLRVAHALLPGGGVDPCDPEPAEIALAGAPVAVGVGIRAHQLLVGEPVA